MKLLDGIHTHYKNLKPLGHMIYTIKVLNIIKPSKRMINEIQSENKYGKAFDILNDLIKRYALFSLSTTRS